MAPGYSLSGEGKTIPGQPVVNVNEALYTVRPFRQPCRGIVDVPGSKSITNRAMLCAALSQGTKRLENALFSRDTRIMGAALRQLGFAVQENGDDAWIEIEGLGGSIPNKSATLDFGNAGTAGRFLTALCASCEGGVFYCDGDPEMRQRPYEGLIRALESQGAKFVFHDKHYHLPFTIQGTQLSGGEVLVDAAASSQFASALLMVAPFSSQSLNLQISGARPSFIRLTVEVMRQFGAVISQKDGTGFCRVEPGGYSSEEKAYSVEPDVTAASYFLVLPRLTGGNLTIRGLQNRKMLQGDVAFCEVLEDLGAQFEEDPHGLFVEYRSCEMYPRQYDFEYFSDTFLTLAAITPALGFSVQINGIGHTRHQETDRVAGMARELNKFGLRVEESAASLSIQPADESFFFGTPPGIPVEVETYQDHRFAMSFAILGCADLSGRGDPIVAIRNPGCCSKTFPRFFEKLDSLYQFCHDE